MNRSLVDTFYYGHGDWPSPFSPLADSVYNQPVREMQMVHIARQQLAAQERARKDILKSNIAGAQIIACEMERQTQALDGAIQGMGKQVTDAIGASADQVTGAIEELGQALCMELSEIRWQLAQQSATLDKILEILSESRSNETRQLVRQGLRHYLNGEYTEAEERFRKALDFDTTDYQLLMNLAFISLHKNEADEAFSFFKKALSLPEDLDDASKARNLWATARLFYSQKDFPQAQVYAEKALRYEQVAKAEGLFKLGVYEALAGQEDKAIGSLRNAIDMDRALFGRCAVEPDLLVIQDRVIYLLADLAKTTYDKSVDALEGAEKKVKSFENKGLAKECAEPLAAAAARLASLRDQLEAPSYVGCLDALKTTAVVNELLLHVDRLRTTLQKESAARAKVGTKEKHKTTAENTVTDYARRVADRKALANQISGIIAGLVVLYCIIGLVSSARSASDINERGSAAFAILTSWIWIPICGAVAFFLPRFVLKIVFGTWWKGDRVKEAERNQYSLEAELSTAKSKEAEISRNVETLQREIRTLLSSI